MLEVILMGLGVSVITELFKKLVKKLGLEWAKIVTLVGVFVVSLIAAAVLHYTPQPILAEASQVFAASVTIYQVLWKNLLEKVVEKYS